MAILEKHTLRMISPRGLSRVLASTYIGVGVTKFDAMVEDGRMPPPKQIDGRKVWDILELDQAFDALPSAVKQQFNPWDEPA